MIIRLPVNKSKLIYKDMIIIIVYNYISDKQNIKKNIIYD